MVKGTGDESPSTCPTKRETFQIKNKLEDNIIV